MQRKMIWAIMAASAAVAMVFAPGCSSTSGSSRVLSVNPAKSAIVAKGRANENAAKELQTHFREITGVGVKIVDSRSKALPGDYLWLVGTAPEGEKTGDLKPEEARYLVTDACTYFWGEARGGQIKAVYRFLERALGVRWPWAGAISCDSSKTIDVRDFEDAWAPELKMRGVRGSGRPFVEWRFRLLSGGHDGPNYGHAFTKYWGRFGQTKKHLEYFAMRRDGKRMPVGVEPDTAFNIAASTSRPAQFISLCPSSDALVKQIIEDWLPISGRQRCVNICENDAVGENVCHCEACKKLDEPPPPGTKSWWQNYFSDRYVNLANRVLKEARKVRPDAEVAMYAYNATEQAPIREKLSPGIIVGYVPTLFSREAITEYYDKWAKAGATKHFYRPNRRCYFRAAFLPLGYEKQFFDVFQLTYSFGSIGSSEDGSAPASPLGWFADYVILKGLSEPRRSFEYWEDHYMDAFGAAKEDIKAYFRFWRDHWERMIAPDVDYLTEIGLCFNFTRGLYWNLEKYFSDEDFVKSSRLLHLALSRENLDSRRRGFIEQLLDAHEHSRKFAKACCSMTEDAARELIDYRKRNGQPIFQYGDTYYNDICGMGRVDDDSKTRLQAPAEDWVIVDAYGYTDEAMEIKRHFELLGGKEIAVVKDESLVPPGKFAVYVGRVPFGQDNSNIDNMPARRGIWAWMRGKGVFIYGKKTGISSAVNEFLENEMWVRWPWGGEIAVNPKADGTIKIYDKAGSWMPNERFGRRSFKMPGKDSGTFLGRMQLSKEDAEIPLKGKPYRLHVKMDGKLHGDEEKMFNDIVSSLNAGTADFEITADEPKTAFDWYRAYIVAKALQDPLKPCNFFEKRYFQSYGAVAGEMRAYFKLLSSLAGREPGEADKEELARLRAAMLSKKGLLEGDLKRVKDVLK